MKPTKNKQILNIVSISCASLLFIAVIRLPIEYYTFLRIVTFIGAIFTLFTLKPAQVYWKVIFMLIAILFNPIVPIYLYIKAYWIPLDIISGILFLLMVFIKPLKKESEKTETRKQREFKRDKIY